MPKPSPSELCHSYSYCTPSSADVGGIANCTLASLNARDISLCAPSSTHVGDIFRFAPASADASDIVTCALVSTVARDIVSCASASVDVRDASYCAPSFAFVGDTNAIKYEDNADIDTYEYVMSVLSEHSIEKFDSGASHCMSGDPNRLIELQPLAQRIRIVGFNDTRSEPTSVGINIDEKEEYYVSDMPSNLTLLCANAYCQDGCAVLFADDGIVLRMSKNELVDLKDFLRRYPVIKHLKVRNHTYEVDNYSQLHQDNLSACSTSVFPEAEAFQGTASRFFNTKVHVSNQTERILTLLMTGLTFRDWHMHVKNNSLGGIPPDLTIHGLNRFEYRYGRTPDIVQLAHPLNVRDSTGLRSEPADLTRLGQRIEIDCLYSDYNVRESVPSVDSQPFTVKTRKLPTHGGAIAGAVCVDCYSSFVHGQLLKSVAHPELFVEGFLARLKLDDVIVSTLAADGGVVTNSVFQVLTTKVDTLCKKWNVQSIERSEPYAHARVTGSVEREIGLIKSLIRLAITLILRNPNFAALGFTALMIFKLWGEFFLWAIIIINLKPCPSKPDKSRYEVYHNKVPNMQDIRLLPIGCIIIVVRPYSIENEFTKGVFDNQKSGQIGIYVGPSLLTPGCVRVAVVSKGKLMIITTSNFRSASDGGGLNIYPHIERGVSRLIKDQNSNHDIGNEDVLVTDPEAEHKKLYEDLGTKLADEEKTDENLPLISNVSALNKSTKRRNRKTKKQHTDLAGKQHDVISFPMPSSVSIQLNNTSDNHASIDSNVKRGVISSSASANPPKRSSRILERRQRQLDIGATAIDAEELKMCCFADWSTHADECVYWSWTDFCFMQVSADIPLDCSLLIEEGYRAVTDGVPKNFEEALRHPMWGVPAQKELNTILSVKAMTEVNSDIALDAIRHSNADLMYLFPVYEEKWKDGAQVYKVRLVADGRTHYHAGETYSATPSREELLILVHVIAALNWDYAHIDEVRAFLKAPYKGKNRAFVKFRGGSQYYEIFGALYGLKTAPRDYQEEVARRLESLGFTRLVMCSCIYIMKRESDIVIVYDYVDDFIFTGSSRLVIENVISEFRNICETTEPIWDAERVLGMEFRRIRDKHIITITMTAKIIDVCKKTGIILDEMKNIPMPLSGYIVKDTEFDAMDNQDQSAFLDKSGISEYMAIVGGLIWISGLRLDITFSTMYLAWNTKTPRRHHMRMAKCVLTYLNTTKDLPLVLGGSSEINVVTYTDASLGTAPRGRSVIANMTKLNDKAGAVSAHSKATNVVFSSSFEAELDGVTRGLKCNSRIVNVLTELRLQMSTIPHLWSDNKAMVNFIHGEGVAKGVRHMELRMWYVRERYKQGNVLIDWMTGQDIPADKLTKLGCREEHEIFTRDIMGLGLLE